MDKEVKMSVSPICVKDGKRYAFVSFTDENRSAEGTIPDCKIMLSNGFSSDEIEQLEAYMQRELPKLKRMAAGIRMIDAFLK